MPNMKSELENSKADISQNFSEIIFELLNNRRKNSTEVNNLRAKQVGQRTSVKQEILRGCH